MGEDRKLVRRFPAELHASGDGRTIEGRAVPYGVIASVVDPGRGPSYREGFAAGAFRRVAKAASRILLRYEHRDDLMSVIGPAEDLEEREDGLYGSWRATGAPGDHALALIEAGVLTGLSVGFVPLRRDRAEADGVIWRRSCHLEEVSLTMSPAYAESRVLAVRHELPPELELPARDTALDERLARLGLEV